ncbi:hypothetical protein [Bradyrhizobium sp. USDA 3458]|uniref:hypothetical protein n=1 Tax=Bradyrhizobium sp. USDA 3458 TaxID=2591461 RepID=UPI0011437306|nr:hypothetical protein [Bradyrhizobium sp. USDA 3458]
MNDVGGRLSIERASPIAKAIDDCARADVARSVRHDNWLIAPRQSADVAAVPFEMLVIGASGALIEKASHLRHKHIESPSRPSSMATPLIVR